MISVALLSLDMNNFFVNVVDVDTSHCEDAFNLSTVGTPLAPKAKTSCHKYFGIGDAYAQFDAGIIISFVGTET